MVEVYEKGQVVIPKFIRDMFKIRPGSSVNFRVEGEKIILVPEYDVAAEFEKLAAQGSSSFEETEKAIADFEKARSKARLHVP